MDRDGQAQFVVVINLYCVGRSSSVCPKSLRASKTWVRDLDITGQLPSPEFIKYTD